jgi:hypothetical protein
MSETPAETPEAGNLHAAFEEVLRLVAIRTWHAKKSDRLMIEQLGVLHFTHLLSVLALKAHYPQHSSILDEVLIAADVDLTSVNEGCARRNDLFEQYVPTYTVDNKTEKTTARQEVVRVVREILTYIENLDPLAPLEKPLTLPIATIVSDVSGEIEGLSLTEATVVDSNTPTPALDNTD